METEGEPRLPDLLFAAFADQYPDKAALYDYPRFIQYAKLKLFNETGKHVPESFIREELFSHFGIINIPAPISQE